MEQEEKRDRQTGSQLHRRVVRARNVGEENTASVRLRKVKQWRVSSAPLGILREMLVVHLVKYARVATFRKNVNQTPAPLAQVVATLGLSCCLGRTTVGYVKHVRWISWAIQMHQEYHERSVA